MVQDASGKYTIEAFDLSPEQVGIITITDFGKDKKAVILFPSVQHQLLGFDENNPSHIFSWTVSTKSKEGTFSINTAEESVTSSIESTSLLQQIALLQAEVARLQAQLTVLREAQPSKTASCEFTKDIAYGIKNSQEVRCLQEFLKSEGNTIYPEGLVTGNFLKLTEAAVIRFQEKYATEVLHPLNIQKGTGFVGAATRRKIEDVVQKEQLVLTIVLEGV